MPYKDKVFDAFRRHQLTSRQRGIAFHFTFEEWVAWWEEHLGPDWLSMRGTKRHQYVMARKGDKGDYCRSNVDCITASKNKADDNRNNPHGNGGAFRGMKHRPETKAKLSETRIGAGNPFYGRQHSDATRQKMREAHKRRIAP
jgi:hypothetical protein